jgi:Uma2 family endonuclease
MTEALGHEPRLTFEAFLGFLETRAEGERWELIDGRLSKMMTPAAFRHQAIVRNLLVLLDTASVSISADWSAYPGAGVHIAQLGPSALIPDILVRGGSPPEEWRCDDPILIVEVLSRSTKRLDRGWKKTFFKEIPSLQHYVIVHQDRMRVDLLTRERGWTETPFEAPNAQIRLSALGVSATLRDIYRGTGIVE